MKLADIRQHLSPYSIVQKRRTTINHAFASALAPCDTYDDEKLRRAMAVLGQVDVSNLSCVYCESPAETWDHLIGLVKDSELNGYGHQIGNLVPSCGRCNSKKGSKDWQTFLAISIGDAEKRSATAKKIATYLQEFAVEIDLCRIQNEQPEAWRRYTEIKREIIDLMSEADALAAKLRAEVVRK